MSNIFKRLMALVMVLALMIPAVALSEEGPAITMSVDKSEYSVGDDVVITWEADPAQVDITKGYDFMIDVGYGEDRGDYGFDVAYSYAEKGRCVSQTSGTYTLTMPECMSGFSVVDVHIKYYDIVSERYKNAWVGVSLSSTSPFTSYFDVESSIPLNEIVPGDKVEFTYKNLATPSGMKAMPSQNTFEIINYATGDVYTDEGKETYSYTFADEGEYFMWFVTEYESVGSNVSDNTYFEVQVGTLLKVNHDTTTPAPSDAPTSVPTTAPSTEPTTNPTTAPTNAPTSAPTGAPSVPVELNLDAITIGAKQTVDTVKVVSGENINWTSSNEKVATVDADGKIKGVKKGTATITATSANGESDSVEVTVVAKDKGVKKIKLNKKKATIKQGEKLALKATLTPANAKNKKIIWTSSNTSVATVNAKGKVKAVGVGEATITAISSSGKSATCKVTVTGAKVKKIVIEGKKKMKVGETQTLIASILPEFAENKELKWKSSSKKIATVDENGLVTALKKGTVTITATAKDGSKVKATFSIKIKK